MDELLPCPFCGGEVTEYQQISGFWRICCKECYAEMRGSHMEMNREAWNRRVGLGECRMEQDNPYEHQERHIDELEAENAKLRELAKAVTDFVDGSECDECSHRRHCEDNNRMFCGDELSYHAFYRMREELGIEV